MSHLTKAKQATIMETNNNKKKFDRQCLLRISIGLIYLWFGILKFFPNISPAEELAKDTINLLTFYLVPSSISYCVLAFWETVIGLLLILNFKLRIVIVLTLLHMLGTFTPLFLISDIVFGKNPATLTLIGQYIMKNLIIISALIVIWPTKSSKKVPNELKITEKNRIKGYLQRI